MLSLSFDLVTCFVLDELFTLLSSMIRGRIWDGKEKILCALTALLQVTGKDLASFWSSEEVYREVF